MIIKFECPYCKHKQEVVVKQGYGKSSEVATCDNCDLRYVLDVETKIKVKALKIEGEED